jgi:hypothetical protein
MPLTRLYDKAFVIYILQLFNEGNVSGPAVAYLYSISIHTLLSKSKITVAIASLILPASSGKVGNNGGMCTSSLMNSQKKKKIKGHKVRQAR